MSGERAVLRRTTTVEDDDFDAYAERMRLGARVEVACVDCEYVGDQRLCDPTPRLVLVQPCSRHERTAP